MLRRAVLFSSILAEVTMKLLLKATTQRPGSYLLRHGSDDMGRKRKSKVVAEDLTLSAKKQKLAEGSPKESLPEGIHHYQTVEEVPWDLQKYVAQDSGSSHCTD